MNFKKKVNGSWIDIPHYIHNTSTDTITTLPADIYANDTTATVGLKGQAVQSGTPTPDNPTTPQGCGERTGNLIDIYANNTSNGYVNNALLRSDGSVYSPSSAYISEYLPIEDNTTYTYYTGGRTGVAQAVCFYNAVKEYISGTPYDSQTAITFTTPQGTKYYRCTVMRTASDTESYKKAMLNTGSTPLPYEPYGYKIPISSANTTTPVYLGEVESTRRIKKYVVTGQESEWNYDSTYTRFTLRIPNAYFTANRSDETPCSHYVSIHDGRPVGDVPDKSIYTTSGGGVVYINIVDLTYSSLSDFKTYLQQQYANGTPVTVWYVLAEPTTGIVNEPLRKIGDYADTVSSISIPTIAGADSFDVLTTLKPSEVTVNYKGWHPTIVHERANGAWT